MFATPAVAVFDALRIIAASLSLLIIGLTPYAITRPSVTWHQRLRFLGSALLGSAIVGAYLESLGTLPSQWWRTPLVTLGILASFVGLVAHLRTTGLRGPRGRHDR